MWSELSARRSRKVFFKVSALKNICSLCEQKNASKNLLKANQKPSISVNNIKNLNITMVKNYDSADASFVSSSSSSSLSRAPVMPRIIRSSAVTDFDLLDEDFEKGITKNNLVFGGSFPIDAPISARQLGVSSCKKSSKTFQIDTPCCAPPHVCSDHLNVPSKCAVLSNNPHCLSSKRFIQNPRSKSMVVVQDPRISIVRNSVEEGILTYPVDESLCDEASGTYSDEGDDDDDDDDAENLGYDFDGSFENEDDAESFQYECGRDYADGNPGSCKDIHTSTQIFSTLSESSGEIDYLIKDFSNLRSKEMLSHPYNHSNAVFCPQLQTVEEKETEDDQQRCREPSGQSDTSLMTITEANEEKESQEAPKSSGDSVDGTIKHEDVMKQSNEDNMKDDDKKPSGFLGSLFGGWRKGTNQAKLPDDKNPTIVWDDQKKKWVNKDGDDSDEVAPPPPPSTMMSQPPSILRGGIKKSRYVDPVGDKGRTKTPVHSIPPPIPAMGVMPVSKIAANPEKPMDGFRQEAQPFAGYPETPLTASQPQENQNMGTDAPNAIPMMNPVEPQQQPLFFNPAQFQTPQSGPSKPAKRAGPTKRSYNPQR